MKRSFFKDTFKFKYKGKTSKVTEKSRIPLAKVFNLSFVVNAITIVGVLLLQKFLPPEVPLFYGLAEGEDQLSEKNGLVGLGLLSLIITSMNLLLAIIIKNDFLKKTLIVAGLAISILTLITVSQIILLIGSF